MTKHLGNNPAISREERRGNKAGKPIRKRALKCYRRRKGYRGTKCYK